jgi:DNA invertase Pin-like site-specific DNA recombinase
MSKTKRVALYVRVSTNEQTTENQIRELTQWAERAGHDVVKVYGDAGISGAKGRDKRPGFDAMLKAAAKREFDILAVWSSDRLGRSLPNLIEVLQTIRTTGRELYIHTQALDTSTASGRALFQMLGVFAELEREMIVARVNAGMTRAKCNGTRSGKAIGRPRRATDADIRSQLAKGPGDPQDGQAAGVWRGYRTARRQGHPHGSVKGGAASRGNARRQVKS